MKMKLPRKAVGRDRLSELPDQLLHHILSRLRSQQVVQTCVLSRRWQNVWRAAPVIDLNDLDFVSDVSRLEGKTIGQQRELYSEENVRHRWVRRALRCSPAALYVRNRSYGGAKDRNYHDKIELSPSVVASQAGGCRSLRILRLDNVIVEDGVMEQLDALFPVLEDLELRDCSCPSSTRITSATLRSLTVSRNCGRRFSFDTSRLPPVAAAPRLATLRLDVHAGDSLDHMPRLVHNRTDGTFMQNAAFLESLCELLGSVVASASCVQLSGFTTVVISSHFLLFRSFPIAIYAHLHDNELMIVFFASFASPFVISTRWWKRRIALF
ncbi:hypothetical protein PR202_gb15597 [Eleusine coracana subsp. coracana]|uniref:F-box domain-containing protein n=1 Tax=Eleusine coracana subsp. coracana TaxID=191504 RepID=A0AAV5EYF3_ELECO|nr:hypothetical protein PR202_gb15597 [Eleusine coracana subsp. coracana]